MEEKEFFWTRKSAKYLYQLLSVGLFLGIFACIIHIGKTSNTTEDFIILMLIFWIGCFIIARKHTPNFLLGLVASDDNHTIAINILSLILKVAICGFVAPFIVGSWIYERVCAYFEKKQAQQ